MEKKKRIKEAKITYRLFQKTFYLQPIIDKMYAFLYMFPLERVNILPLACNIYGGNLFKSLPHHELAEDLVTV